MWACVRVFNNLLCVCAFVCVLVRISSFTHSSTSVRECKCEGERTCVRCQRACVRACVSVLSCVQACKSVYVRVCVC